MGGSQSANKINFFSRHSHLWLRRRRLLKQFILLVFKTEKRKLQELNFIFCSDKFLLKINREYLNHNSYTDIITFNLSSDPTRIQGEIYISLDRVKENAVTFNNSPSEELLRVIFHGVLHLCGYKDNSKVDKELMRSKENYYLKRFQIYVSREIGST